MSLINEPWHCFSNAYKKRTITGCVAALYSLNTLICLWCDCVTWLTQFSRKIHCRVIRLHLHYSMLYDVFNLFMYMDFAAPYAFATKGLVRYLQNCVGCSDTYSADQYLILRWLCFQTWVECRQRGIRKMSLLIWLFNNCPLGGFLHLCSMCFDGVTERFLCSADHGWKHGSSCLPLRLLEVTVLSPVSMENVVFFFFFFLAGVFDLWLLWLTSSGA